MLLQVLYDEVLLQIFITTYMIANACGVCVCGGGGGGGGGVTVCVVPH